MQASAWPTGVHAKFHNRTLLPRRRGILNPACATQSRRTYQRTPPSEPQPLSQRWVAYWSRRRPREPNAADVTRWPLAVGMKVVGVNQIRMMLVTHQSFSVNWLNAQAGARLPTSFLIEGWLGQAEH